MCTCSSINYPNSNGEVERFNRTLKAVIQLAKIQGADLSEYCRDFIFIYRATNHCTTGKTPSELLHGRKMKTKLDVDAPMFHGTDLSQLQERFAKKQEKQRHYWNSGRSISGFKFNIGDYVRVRKIGNIPKAEKCWTEPLKVVRRVGKFTYELSNGKR